MFETVASPGMGGKFFDGLTRRHQVRVSTLHMDWTNCWDQLVNFGLNSTGPDVSEVGTTWLGGLYAMEALHSLAPGDTPLFSAQPDYPPGIWESCQILQSDRMMAIPWTLDLRVVLYRRDLLEKAKVDEATAFADSHRFVETLQRLKAAGISTPLGLTTSRTGTRLSHDLACWVWDAGGAFRTADGSRMMLMDPKSRAGMEAYFDLHQFMPPEMMTQTEIQVYSAFFAGRTAVAVLPERAYLEVLDRRPGTAPEVRENAGLAMLMQSPYLGGSALAVWRHSLNYQDSLKLIEFLSSPEAWQELYKHRPGYTPARLDLLKSAPIAASPHFPAIQKSLEHARSFHSGYRWRGVESRLVPVVEKMWTDLRLNVGLNIASEVEKRFTELCTRIEQTILAAPA